jgi:hypothetical protein
VGTNNNIPQKGHSRHAVDFDTVDRLYAEGHSYRKIAEILGSNYAKVYRVHQAGHPDRKEQPVRRRHLTPSNGAPPSAPDSAPPVPIVWDATPERIEVMGEPMGAPDSAPESAPRLRDLEARVSVLEAFIATMQRHPAHVIGAPKGALQSAPIPATKKRGFVIACDLSDALDRYADLSGLQVRDILDMALRRYLADVAGEEVHRA